MAVSEIRSQAYHAVYTAGEVACIFIILLVEQIVALENLEATEEDIAEAMAVIARQNRLTVEQMKPYIDAEFEAAVVRNVLTTKAMQTFLGVTVDGIKGPETVKAWQTWCNNQL
mgnify:CR=1 FL=1